MHRIRSTVRRIMTAVRGIIMTDATVTIMVSRRPTGMEETRETMVTDHSARNGDRNGRNDGQRPYQNNGRPGQGQGDRNNNRNNGFRGGNNGGGRLDREIDRFNKEGRCSHRRNCAAKSPESAIKTETKRKTAQRLRCTWRQEAGALCQS